MTKRDKIKLLLNLSNSSSNALQAFRQKLEDAPIFDEAAKADLVDKFEKANKEYLENQVAIYEKWLSERAIDASIAFYSSDAGQDTINAMPHINQELAVVGGKLMHTVLTNLIKAMDEGQDFGGSMFGGGNGWN